MRIGGPSPRTSYRVVIPSMIAVATMVLVLRARRALDLPPLADVLGKCPERVQRRLRHVGVTFHAVVEGGREIADSREPHADSSVEPRASAESSDHGNGNPLRHRRTGDG